MPWSKHITGCLALWLLTVVTYAPVINSGFIWDDDDYVTENPELRTLSGLGRIWFVLRATPQYYPIVHTTFWIEYQLWGLHPVGYHLVNVVIHALSSSLIYLLFARWGWRGSWLAAVLFAVHPVHVESVAWVTERKNVLSGLFYLLAAGAYFEFDRLREMGQNFPPPWRWHVLALVCFIAALLSKSVTCTLPAALLVVIWMQRGTIRVCDIVPTLPLFAVGIACGLLTAQLERLHVGAEGAEFAWSPAKRLLVAGRSIWFYIETLFWPHPLIFFYPRWPTPTAEFWPYL